MMDITCPVCKTENYYFRGSINDGDFFGCKKCDKNYIIKIIAVKEMELVRRCEKCNCEVTLEHGWLVCYHTVVREAEKENYPAEWTTPERLTG